ncbi:MAG: DinB family protein [Acidobacteria bacterium]|nr:DinB family protein [Acidobacteriota bacterium]
MNWTQLLVSEIEINYSTTDGLMAKVPEDALSWKPPGGDNWMTTGQLLHHLSNACGAACQAFLTGDWGLSPGKTFDGLTDSERLPPAASLPSAASVAEARRLLADDKELVLKMIGMAGDHDLSTRTLASPWKPSDVHPLGYHFLRMVRHLDRHKSQLFYYLKLQGVPVSTPDLWG